MVSKLVVLICAVIAGLIGLGIGYYLRFIISLGKKGSMELEIKEMLLAAKEEAKKITADAQSKASLTLEETRKEIKGKRRKIRASRIAHHKKRRLARQAPDRHRQGSRDNKSKGPLRSAR